MHLKWCPSSLNQTHLFPSYRLNADGKDSFCLILSKHSSACAAFTDSFHNREFSQEKKQNKEWWMPAATSREDTWWFPNKTGRTFFFPADVRNQGATSEQVSAPRKIQIRFYIPAAEWLSWCRTRLCWMFILYEALSSVMWTMCDLCYHSCVDWWYIHPCGLLACTYCSVWDYRLMGRMVTWCAPLHSCSQICSGSTV